MIQNIPGNADWSASAVEELTKVNRIERTLFFKAQKVKFRISSTMTT